MQDEKKTKAQLIEELAALRTRSVEFDVLEARLKQAEEALSRLQGRLSSIVSSMDDMVFVFDSEGAITFASAPDERLYKPRADFLGKKHAEIMPPDVHRLFTEARQENIRGRAARYDYSLDVRGEMRWYSVNLSPIMTEKGIDGSIAVVRDITEQKRAEEKLRESEARYSTLFTGITDAIFVHRVTEGGYPGPIIEVNDIACQMLGYSREELLAMGILGVDAPESGVDVHRVVEDLLAGRDVLFEQTHMTKDGRRIPVEVHAQAFQYKGKDAILSTARDVTERKRAAKAMENMERQVQHVQKLESLGVMAGGIAHDFNNLLMTVLGNADLAMQELPPAAPACRYVKEIEVAARHGADLTRQMLAYSGRGAFLVGRVNINDLVIEMGELIDVSVPKTTTIKYGLTDPLPAVDADATQLRQVVMNLITNAAEAIGSEVGEVVVSTGVIDCDRAYFHRCYLNDSLSEGPFVYVEVRDTGCGMDEETQKKIFDPFFTTKFTGRGLGLAAVLGIIRGHKGTIEVSSVPNAGATFRVLFPALLGAAEPLPRAPDTSREWRGSGCLLLVDDEEAIRTLGKRMLERLGFDVVLARDGQEAVDVFRERHGALVCVVLDLAMPRMGGVEAWREMRRIDPNVPVLISSGYNEQQAVAELGEEDMPAAYIQKPYKIADLRARLMHVIERKPGRLG